MISMGWDDFDVFEIVILILFGSLVFGIVKDRYIFCKFVSDIFLEFNKDLN